MNPSNPARSRYELREVLGRGGMGIIYKAYDTLMNREVALKTIIDTQSQSAWQLFYKEWGLQASITHPNIAEIYDIGQMEYEGAIRPYFVMPLLPGATLSDLISTSSTRLTVERAIGMIVQACRGLQAAHERGLIHRDLKPSNIFVLSDDSVKVIDFGIAHAEASVQTSVRGTLAYMAPELLQMKPASVASDIFSLGVLCYETLTHRRPFEGATDAEISQAILFHNPPPASDLNQSVPLAVSRAVHKALAKQPWHRYSSAREFGETLQKTFRGEAVEFFDPEKVAPRLDRASRTFERGEYQVSMEILSELESEGHIDQEISMLRHQVEQAQRQVTVRQFLETARRFYEEEEFALALRKVQEALDLDPNATDAQALKHEVEMKRREKKIEEWGKLAQKHLENNAFAHSRSAVQNLLELRPNDTRALALQDEIRRREQEFERLSREKNRLYNLAAEAWRRGEVTAALTNLERWQGIQREAPDTDADRLLSLQNFYNQVRTEHEAIKNSYDQARQSLANGDFATALGICEQYLAKYPSHALFQALKYDVEERQRQDLSALIAETDRRAENEPDLERRYAILEEASRQHPDESHFQKALRLSKDKRDLVASVVSKARLHEDQGRFAEALDQWEILRAIHTAYPGLDYEVERVRKRRDAQSRAEARAQWVAQIDRLLESGDFGRAVDSARQARGEFPSDAELEELERIAEERAAKHREALRLLDQGRAALAGPDAEEGLEMMRRAHRMEETSPVIRTVLVEALAERARALMETDAAAADELLGQVLELDPSHSLGLNLRALRADQKREEFVSWCTAQARRLHAAADLEGAIALVRQGLASYPNEPRLSQLLSAVDRARQDSAKKQSRKRDLDALKKLKEEVEAASAPAVAERAVSEAREIAARYQGDEEFQSMAAAVRHAATAIAANHLTNAAGAKPPGPAPAAPPAAPAPSPPAPVQPAPPPPTPRAGLPGPPAAQPVEPVAEAPGTAGSGSAPQQPSSKKPDVRYMLAAAGIILAAGLGYGLWKMIPRREAPQAPQSPVAGPAVPAEPAQQRSSVRVVTETEDGQAQLSGNAMNAGAVGEFLLDSLPDGDQTLVFKSPQGEVSADLRLSSAALPILAAPLRTRILRLVLIGHYKDRALVYSSDAKSRAAVDGEPARDVPLEGLSITGLSEGQHKLVLEGDGVPHSFSFRTGGPPAITAFVFPPPPPGTGALVLMTGEDGATVLLNGKVYRRKTQDGGVRIADIKLGKLRVQVSKEGFETPPEQEVEIKKGEETKVEIKLKPINRLATLRIQGPVGAQVFVDSEIVGVVAPDGTFSSALSPGAHAIELRRRGARSKTHQHNFQPGEVVTLSQELALAQPTGTLRLEVSPANASVTIRGQGQPESQARPLTQNPTTLPEGNYVIAASAPGYSPATFNTAINGGGAVSLPIVLRPVPEQPKKTEPVALGLDGFDAADAWLKDGEWMVRRGGEFVTFRPASTDGVFTFEIALRKGKRLQWFLNFSDQRNFALFRVDGKYFYRLQVKNGRTDELNKVSYRSDRVKSNVFRIDVTARQVTHQIRDGAQWVTLDQWSDSAGAFSTGKFGFFIPGGDEYGVKDFSFRQR